MEEQKKKEAEEAKRAEEERKRREEEEREKEEEIQRQRREMLELYKTKQRVVNFDSDSEEEPLPEGYRPGDVVL